MTTIEALEKWKNGHKSRWVEISIDNGYGANCWEVVLYGQGKKVVAAECSFFEGEFQPWFVTPKDQNADDWDWPGLEATIQAGLKRAEELGL